MTSDMTSTHSYCCKKKRRQAIFCLSNLFKQSYLFQERRTMLPKTKKFYKLSYLSTRKLCICHSMQIVCCSKLLSQLKEILERGNLLIMFGIMGLRIADPSVRLVEQYICMRERERVYAHPGLHICLFMSVLKTIPYTEMMSVCLPSCDSGLAD